MEEFELRKEASTKTVMIVDDDKDLATLLSQRLISFGYKTKAFNDSEPAIKFLKSGHVDLLITDINMPGRSGLEFLEWMRQNQPTIPVVLITGFLNENDAKEALDKGCFGFLAKPISRKELSRVVANAVNLREGNITDQDFARIPIDDFITGKVVNFPVYVKLQDERFLKIAHTGNEISLERIKKFKEDNVHELWINKEDLDNYLRLCEKLYEASKKGKGLPPHRRIALIKHSSEILYERLRIADIDPQLITQGVDYLVRMLNQVSKVKRIGDLIIRMQKSNNPAYSKAIIEATLCGLIARALQWTSRTNIVNVMLGSFLKDIGIYQLPEDIQAKKVVELSDDELSIYKEHPMLGVEALEGLDGITSPILDIIAQHHEDGTASGYPQKLSFNKVFPPAVLVRVVDQFYEKTFVRGNGEQKLSKEVILDTLDSMPRNSIELSFAKALKTLFRTKTLNEAIESLAKK